MVKLYTRWFCLFVFLQNFSFFFLIKIIWRIHILWSGDVYLLYFYWNIIALHCCVSFCCIIKWIGCVCVSFPCGSAGKKSACNAGDLGLTPDLGRSPGGGKGYPLQYSGLENSIYIYISPPFLASLLPHAHPTFLGHHRAPSWSPCAIQPLSYSSLFYIW